MASVQLGSKSVGSTVKLNVNGVVKNFLVIHQGRPSSMYDSSCNGTWLLMQDIYENRQWHNVDQKNDYANSTIHNYLNGTLLNRFDTNIRNAIKQVKIPYRPGSGTSSTVYSGANGLAAKIFLLSGYEMGWTTSDNPYFPADGARVSYFDSGTGTTANNKRIAYLGGTAKDWSLRTPRTNYAAIWGVDSKGAFRGMGVVDLYGIRPALVLPYDVLVSDNGIIITNTPPTIPNGITYGQPNAGKPLLLSTGGSTDPDGDNINYVWEHRTDNGVYTQIGVTTEPQIVATVPTSGTTYQARVKAVDDKGAESGYTTGLALTINYYQTFVGGLDSTPIPVSKIIIAGHEVKAGWVGVNGQIKRIDSI